MIAGSGERVAVAAVDRLAAEAVELAGDPPAIAADDHWRRLARVRGHEVKRLLDKRHVPLEVESGDRGPAWRQNVERRLLAQHERAVGRERQHASEDDLNRSSHGGCLCTLSCCRVNYTCACFVRMKLCIPTNILMSNRHRQMLVWLAAHYQLSMGAVVRRLIERGYEAETLREAIGKAQAQGRAQGRS